MHRRRSAQRLCGAPILVRGKDGVPLLVEAIQGSDYALAAAAVRSAMELPGSEVTDALVAALPKASAERQGLLIVALADRIGRPRRVPGIARRAPGGAEQRRAAAHPRAPHLEARGQRLVCSRVARGGGGRQRRGIAGRDGIARKPARRGRRRSGCGATITDPGEDADRAHGVGHSAAYCRRSSRALAGCR